MWQHKNVFFFLVFIDQTARCGVDTRRTDGRTDGRGGREAETRKRHRKMAHGVTSGGATGDYRSVD